MLRGETTRADERGSIISYSCRYRLANRPHTGTCTMSPLIDRMLDPSMSIRFQFLFSALILMLATPVLLPDRFMEHVVPPLFTFLALAALVSVATRKRTLVIGILLGAPALLLQWIAPRDPSLMVNSLMGEILADLFLLWVTVAILAHVLRARTVSTEVLFAVACVYLLLALIWSMAYGIADAFQPGTLTGSDLSGRGYHTYFSFVTLTTLGYGDITPVTDAGRLLAILEATLGQLFLVIVVARLVGMHTAQRLASARE